MALKSTKTGRVLNATAGTVAPHPVTKKQEETEAVRAAKAITDIRIAGENPFAKKLGAKIGDEVFAEFDSIINADEYTKIVGLNMADHIRETFTLDEIRAMPRVNTNKTDDENYKGNNPDYTKVKDGKKTSRVSFYDTMLESTSWVIKLRKQIEALEAVVGSKEGASKELRQQYVNPPEQKAALSKFRKRLKTAQGKWRIGFRVVQQEALLEEEMGEHITFALTKDANGDVIPGPEPIYLEANVPKGTARPYDNFSVTSFLSLDIEAAKQDRLADTAIATWNALLETLAKDEPEDEADPDNIVISNEKRMETGMASMLSYFHDKPEQIAKLVQRINGTKDFDEVKSLVKTVGDLANEFGALKQHVQKRYERAVMLESAEDGTLDAKSAQQVLAQG